jgi:hypothetical protein
MTMEKLLGKIIYFLLGKKAESCLQLALHGPLLMDDSSGNDNFKSATFIAEILLICLCK